MLYLLAKALLSGALIALASELAKRSPAIGALVVSLPLTSILAFVWFWRDGADNEAIASLAFSTFWFVLPSLPMFLVLPILLRSEVPFWPALVIACGLTVALYLGMIWALGRFGITL